MDAAQQPEVNKEDKKTNQHKGEQKGEKKGENRKRDNKPRQVQYVVKGEEGETQGEQGENQQQKKPKQQREQRERPQFDWDKTKITLESKVPELPAHAPQKPDKEAHFKQLDKIDDDIRRQWDHFNHFVDDIKKQQQDARLGNKDKYENQVKPLGQVIGDKKKLLSEKRNELKGMKTENDALKDEINKLFNQSQEYRNKMKSLDNPDQIIDELARLKESLQQDRLSASEEKRIVSQIASLERSLPFIEPLQKLEKEQKILRTKSGAIGKVMSALYKEIQVLSEEVDQYKSDYDALKDSTKDTVVTKQNPLIDNKRVEVETKVQELKDRKTKVRNDYHASWDKYEDYEDLKHYREWFLRQLDKVKKDSEKKKKEEERKKRQEAREKREAEEAAQEQADADARAKELENVNPFQYQVDLCDTLISYCNKLKPTVAQQAQQQQKQVDIEQVLKSDEWKKEKVTVVKKTQGEDEFFNANSLQALKSKKKNKQPQQQKEAKEEKKEKPDVLQHDLQTIQFFDAVKVAIPFYLTELDGIIKSIQERKEYYLNPDNRAKAKQDQEQESQAKNNKKAQQKAENKDDFPALQ